MLSFVNPVFIFFRIFNFIIIILIFAYFIKKYLRASLSKQIVDKQKYFKSLEANYQNLKNNVEKIEQENKEQEIFAEIFKKKLYKWQEIFNLEQKQKQEQYELVKAEIYKKQVVKQKNITLNYIASRTLISSITDAQKELERKFSENESCKYQDKLIQFLKKESK